MNFCENEHDQDTKGPYSTKSSFLNFLEVFQKKKGLIVSIPQKWSSCEKLKITHKMEPHIPYKAEFPLSLTSCAM